MTICLFEENSSGTLLPLTHINADFELRCGIFTPLERVRAAFPEARVLLSARLALADALAGRHGLAVNTRLDEADLFLSGRVLLDAAFLEALASLRGSDAVLESDGVTLAVAASSAEARAAITLHLRTALLRGELTGGHATAPPRGMPADVRVVDAPVILHPWDLIEHNAAMLRADARFAPPGVHATARISASAEIVAPENVSIGIGAVIGPGVVIDAGEGPVVIGDEVTVMPQAVILGPACIGHGSRIKTGAKICADTSIGPVCRIGGEVEGSIFHSFANKQHEGFVGHSYIGPWTNLGADTNTSDLKNNYGDIRVTLEGAPHSTGRRFLGTIMADHAKCGINTMFNTGTVVGVGSNVYGGGFPPKFLPCFSWGGADGLVTHDIDRCIATAAVVLARRGSVLDDAERALLRETFDRTAAQRRNFASAEGGDA
jgi:UDP-N-acetylglucosamine diphosphorylase / glucose-1-phosphate thymidylyltransferase / UDP-N-acetylgalactosamine diphosphorylase / glucosamine-1-phosphate N-acetyltransferase / galactosamine-1-phosphate N-acetyltransferase